MTACNDSQVTLGKKAVSAALAGTLAVGMVPGVALAATADEAEAGDGIQTLISDQAFAGGTISAADWNNGIPAGEDGAASDTWTNGVLKIQASGKAISVVPTSVKPFGAANALTVSKNGVMEPGYSLAYYANDGELDEVVKGAQVGSVVYPGKYIAVVTATTGEYEGQEIMLPFQVEPKSLGDVMVYNMDVAANAGGYVTPIANSNQLYFNGAAKNLGVCIPAGNDDKGNPQYKPLASGDYNVKFVEVNGDQSAGSASTTVTNAGSYYAVVEGQGIYKGSQADTTKNPFTVAKFDLKGATVVIPDSTSTVLPSTPASVVMAGDVASLADLSLVKVTLTKAGETVDGNTVPQQIWNKNQKYYVTVSPKDPKDPNFVADTEDGPCNTVFTTANKVGALATFTYGSAPLADKTIIKETDSPYSIGNIKAWYGKTELKETGTVATFNPTLVADGGDITVTKKEAPSASGKTPAQDLAANEPGTYTVTVTAVPDSTDPNSANYYAVGGTKTITITVLKASVNATTNLFVSYQAAGSDEFTGTTAIKAVYDGQGINASQIQWAVKGANGDVLGSGYGNDAGVTVTNAAGEKVNWPLVNAGDYTVTFDMDGYQVTGENTLPITIEKLDVTKNHILLSTSGSALTGNTSTDTNNPNLVVKTAQFGYQWIDTTSAIALPANVWVNTDKKADPNEGDVNFGKSMYAAAPVATVAWEQYNPEKKTWSPVTSLNKDFEGVVRAVITSSKKGAEGNFIFSDAEKNQTVLTYQATPATSIDFVDVLPGVWYFSPIEKAFSNGYMQGYNGQNVFGPNHTLTRGQAACVLFNMSGVNKSWGNEGSVENTGYKSFADVDIHAYYAKAIAWAKQAGVVHGFAGTDNFGPDQTITREQFAAMLWNYAKAVDSDTIHGVDVNAALASKPDGNRVSTWARDAVAWAVQNKIMGNGGVIDPFHNVTRAETAAMAVNFQPKPLVETPSTPDTNKPGTDDTNKPDTQVAAITGITAPAAAVEVTQGEDATAKFSAEVSKGTGTIDFSKLKFVCAKTGITGSISGTSANELTLTVSAEDSVDADTYEATITTADGKVVSDKFNVTVNAK